MEIQKSVQAVYQAYLEEVAGLRRHQKAQDGLLGMGRGLDDAPCHDEFAKELRTVLTAAAQEGMTSQEARETLSFLLETPIKYEGDSLVYWMFLAVQGQGELLLPFLTSLDARALWIRYKTLYPRLSRLPVQRRLARALRLRT